MAVFRWVVARHPPRRETGKLIIDERSNGSRLAAFCCETLNLFAKFFDCFIGLVELCFATLRVIAVHIVVSSGCGSRPFGDIVDAFPEIHVASAPCGVVLRLSKSQGDEPLCVDDTKSSGAVVAAVVEKHAHGEWQKRRETGCVEVRSGGFEVVAMHRQAEVMGKG